MRREGASRGLRHLGGTGVDRWHPIVYGGDARLIVLPQPKDPTVNSVEARDEKRGREGATAQLIGDVLFALLDPNRCEPFDQLAVGKVTLCQFGP